MPSPEETWRGATSAEERIASEASAAAFEPGDCFAVTLGLGDHRLSGAGWIGAPLGFALHVFVFGALGILALWAPIEYVAPKLQPLTLQLAPPPPPPIRGGEKDSSNVGSVLETRTTRLRPVPSIPDQILAPEFDVAAGLEPGFVDGSADGMEGGIPGGVLGGVPGGLVGGVVGGLGSELPRFPVPDVGPSPIRMPQPSYTREAIRDNVTGSVVLRVVIDEQGKVRVLKILRSVPELDEEAIRVVESRWRFQPATKNGRPVATLSDLVVRFNLY